MNQSTWGQAKSLLANAAELPAADRQRFVTDHCLDPELRREVLDLLASPAALSDIVNAHRLQTGARLGPYVIDRLLGSGGMGEVYNAHDTTLNRSVAIKVRLNPLVDDTDQSARFRREAAANRHPDRMAGAVQSSHCGAARRASGDRFAGSPSISILRRIPYESSSCGGAGGNSQCPSASS